MAGTPYISTTIDISPASITQISWTFYDNNVGHGVTEVINYKSVGTNYRTFEIHYNEEDTECAIVADGYEPFRILIADLIQASTPIELQSSTVPPVTKTIQVSRGNVVNWSVSASGYETRSGSTAVNEDKTVLVDLIPPPMIP